jgi:hypothetical protein
MMLPIIKDNYITYTFIICELYIIAEKNYKYKNGTKISIHFNVL